MVRPFITERATRPCCAQSHSGVSPERPWWSALNHPATWPMRARSLTTRMPPPRLPTYTASGRLARHRVPRTPHIQQAVHERRVVAAVQRAGGVGLLGGHPAYLVAIDLLAALAIAHAQRAGAGPAVGEEGVDRIALGDLAVDGRHLLGEIRREHAGLEEPGGFVVAAGLAVAVALEPLGVRPQRLLPGVVAVHACHDPDAARAGRGGHLAEQVARAEERAAMMIRDVGRVEGHDPAAVNEQGVHTQRSPVLGPRCHVEREGVALVEVELSAAAHGGVPGRGRRRRRPQPAAGSRGRSSRGARQELSSIHDRAPDDVRRYRESGSGRSWNLSTLLVVPFPPSMWNGARVLTVAHSSLPFQPALGSSIRPSIHLV